jgi:hypothetical protein
MDKTIRILKKKWRIREVDQAEMQHSDAHGECDPPNTVRKEIRILKGLKNLDRLETILHECIHAADWKWDEETVSQLGKDLSSLLWDLGYRIEN